MHRSPNAPARILKVCVEAFTRFIPIPSPHGLNHTWLCQGRALENDSHWGNGGWKIHFQGIGRGEEPPIAWVQFVGQPVVTSFQ